MEGDWHKKLHIVWFHLYENFGKDKTVETEKIRGCLRLVVGKEMIAIGHKGTFCGDESVLKLNCGDGCKFQQRLHLKCMNFMVSKLNLNKDVLNKTKWKPIGILLAFFLAHLWDIWCLQNSVVNSPWALLSTPSGGLVGDPRQTF